MSVITPFKEYLALEKKYSKHTVLAYVTDVEVFQGYISEEFGGANLVEVNYSLIRSWIVQLINQGVSHQSVNRKIASLKAYYKFLLKTEQIEVSPLVKHQVLKTPKKIQTPYSENELQSLLEEIHFPNTFEGKRDKLIVNLLYSTGMRRSELIGMQLNSVDYSSQALKVLGKRSKERIIPVLSSLIEELEEYIVFRKDLPVLVDAENLFVTVKGNKIYDTLVYRIINSYLGTVTEKSKRSPHMLRHTFASHMLNNGADLNAVKELLGHSSLASTQVYTHNSLGELKKTYQNTHPRSKKK